MYRKSGYQLTSPPWGMHFNLVMSCTLFSEVLYDCPTGAGFSQPRLAQWGGVSSAFVLASLFCISADFVRLGVRAFWISFSTLFCYLMSLTRYVFIHCSVPKPVKCLAHTVTQWVRMRVKTATLWAVDEFSR